MRGARPLLAEGRSGRHLVSEVCWAAAVAAARSSSSRVSLCMSSSAVRSQSLSGSVSRSPGK